MEKAQSFADQNRTDLAVKVMQMAATGSVNFYNRAQALSEIAELLKKKGKDRKGTIHNAQSSLIVLSRGLEQGTDKGQPLEKIKSLIEFDICILMSCNYSFIFDYNVGRNQHPELLRALKQIKKYFETANSPSLLFRLRDLERAAIEKSGETNPSLLADFYTDLATESILDNRLIDSTTVAGQLLRLTEKVPLTMPLFIKFTRLAELLASSLCRQSFPTEVKMVADQKANEILKLSEEFLKKQKMQEINTQMAVEIHRRLATACLSLNNKELTEQHLKLALESTKRAPELWVNIVVISDIYRSLACAYISDKDYKRGAYWLNEELRYLHQFPPLSATSLHPELSTAAELARSDLLLGKGVFELKRGNFKNSEALYRESFVVLRDLVGTLADLTADNIRNSDLRRNLAVQQAMVDSRFIELARQIHLFLLNRNKPNEALTIHREGIAICRERGRFNTSGELYNLLVDALIRAGRFSDLDTIIRECQTPSQTGPGMYEPTVRYKILLTAAKTYLQIGEDVRASSLLLNVQERFEKLGQGEQRVTFYLCLSEAMIEQGKLDQAQKYAERAAEIAQSDCQPMMRATQNQLAEVDLLNSNFHSAKERLRSARTELSNGTADPEIEAALFLAANRNYDAAIARLDSMIRPISSLARLNPLRIQCRLSTAFNNKADHRKFSAMYQVCLEHALGKNHPTVVAWHNRKNHDTKHAFSANK
jgi:tetratricopeptide (TPR) repeat protein